MKEYNTSGAYPKDDYCGRKFGKLLVIEWLGRSKWKENWWLCSCDCGNEKEVSQGKLRDNKTKSCGCLQRERHLKHGYCTRDKGKHPLYSKLDGMKQRCYNKNHKQYKDYGGRGIRVCDEWKKDYESFIKWGIQNGYKDRLTIERKDNNKDYSPENCCFADYITQNRNQTTTYYLTYGGITQSLAAWAEETGIKYSTLYARIQYGWTTEEAITKPVNKVLK